MAENGNGNGKLKAEKVIPLIREHKGNMTMVAKALGVHRTTVWRFKNKHQTVADAFEEARETMIDNVESRLYASALKGEGWAVCFFLKTQGKGRGYVERQEYAGVEDQPLRIIMDE
jgi:AcrR family transcriptional regulator